MQKLSFSSQGHKAFRLDKVQGVTRNTKLIFLDELMPARAESPPQAILNLLHKKGFGCLRESGLPLLIAGAQTCCSLLNLCFHPVSSRRPAPLACEPSRWGSWKREKVCLGHSMDSVAFGFTTSVQHKVCIFRERELAGSRRAHVVWGNAIIYHPLASICWHVWQLNGSFEGVPRILRNDLKAMRGPWAWLLG